MDDIAILEKLNQLKVQIVELEDVISMGKSLPKEPITYNKWYKHKKAGWLIFRTSEKKGFGWNPNGKWVYNDAGWDYSFDDSENWELATDKIVFKALFNEFVDRYVIEGNALLNLSMDKHTVMYDKKHIFSTNTGVWIK